MKKFCIFIYSFLTLLLFYSSTTFAHDFKVGSIYYNIISETDSTVEVTYEGSDYYRSNAYSGKIIIPSTIIYSEKTYSVTSIGDYAFYSCDNLTSVTIGDSVKSIGEYALAVCNKLTSVTIGNAVETIGHAAFDSCDGLTSVTIGNSVKSIENQAFSGCSGITNFTIPYSVTTIGEYAFYSCSGLTEIIIPSNVTNIGGYAFKGCTGLKSVYIENLSTWCCIDFKSKESNPLYNARNLYLNGKLVTNLEIPDNITSIGDYAFYNCGQLESLTIPASVLNIGLETFVGCTIIKTIFLGNTKPTNAEKAMGIMNYVSSATNYGFGTEYSNLSSLFEVGGVKYVIVSAKDRTCDAIDCLYNNNAANVVIDSTVTYKNIKLKVNNINNYALYNNDSIKSVYIKNNGYVGNYAFYDCDGITTVDINNNGYIGNNAFYDCDGIITADINNNGYIGNKAFYDCDGITTADINNNGNIDKYAFYGSDSIRTVTLSNRIDSLKTYVFSECKSLEGIVIPDSIPYVGAYCFQNCSSLKNAVIGKGINIINPYTFAGCSSMTSVKIGENVATIDNYAFSGCGSLPQINIPQATKNINNYVFSGCTNLANVIIEDRNDSIVLGSNGGSPMFNDCKLDSVYIGGKLQYNKTSTYGYSPFYGNTSLRSVVFNDVETTIYDREFMGCTNLQNFTFGKGITSIGESAFRNCSRLPGVIIPDEVGYMGEYCFYGCSALKSAAIGSGVKKILQSTFRNCTSLNNMNIGENVDSIGRSVFNNCTALPEIRIPQATIYLRDSVFYNCTSLADVIIEDRATALNLGSNGYSGSSSATESSNPLFNSCPLDSVYIGGKINYNTTAAYGFSPFFRNTSLRTVVVADSETMVYENEFYGCTGLTDVVIGDGVTSIGNWAFSGCIGLKNFSFGNSLQTIGKDAFSDCTSIVKIVSSCNEPPVCGDQALADINVWDCTLYVPNDYIDAYSAADQWCDFFFVDGAEYTVKFMISGTVVSESAIKYGAEITLPEAPVKSGYTFLGWESVPATMPAENIIINGSYKANDYTITYIVDNEEYYVATYACDSVITPIEAPDKAGHTFSRWESLPATMPAENIEVTAAYDIIPTEVTITINKYGSSTYCSEYPLNFSEVEGLKAYVATGYNSVTGIITVTRVNSAAAGVGLFIMGEQGTYTVPIDNSASDNSMNMLVGTLDKININSTSDDGLLANFRYTTKTGVSTPMFYRFADGSSFSAGKAYLQIPVAWLPSEEANTIGIRFDEGTTTDIKEPTEENSERTVYYDLNGRIVTNPGNGIYIVNGKKVFIK